MNALEKQDILIVDDDPAVRSLLRHALERVGMRCTVAADGLAGAHRMREIEYAVVLLDVMMPRVDGFGFVEYLRDWQESSGTRTVVLMMTAAPNRAELTTIGDMVQAIVPKPFDVRAVADLCRDCVAVRRDYDAERSLRAE